MFFSSVRASWQISAWIRGETLSVSSRIALSAAISGSENQTTKLASDRSLRDKSEQRSVIFLAVHPPRGKHMSSRKPWPCFHCILKQDFTEILLCSAVLCSCLSAEATILGSAFSAFKFLVFYVFPHYVGPLVTLTKISLQTFTTCMMCESNQEKGAKHRRINVRISTNMALWGCHNVVKLDDRSSVTSVLK